MLALKRCSALLPSVLSSFQRPLSSLKVGPDLQDFFLKQVTHPSLFHCSRFLSLQSSWARRRVVFAQF